MRGKCRGFPTRHTRSRPLENSRRLVEEVSRAGRVEQHGGGEHAGALLHQR